MKYNRKWPCACCGDPVIYDDKEETISCKCGICKATFVNLRMFQPVIGS